MKSKITLFWFRRDLRWHDNHALYRALNASENVVPIFIFDENILDELPKDDARLTFIHEILNNLSNTKIQLKISCYYGKPEIVFEELIHNNEIEAVFTNHDYEPYAIQRDNNIAQLLEQNGIGFYTFKDHVIFEKAQILKDNGSPYVVYTPYMKAWKAKFIKEPIQSYKSELLLDKVSTSFDYRMVTLSEMGFLKATQKVAAFRLSPDLIENYEATRNFPARNSTSKLGPHLRFGTVSVREVVRQATQESNEIFWQELIWREFFIQILWHYPHTQHKAFKPKYDRIAWRNSPEEFKKWCEGKTGYPIVDAGMRELNSTGFMHNRVRMITASFLCKHLLIDWRLGEAYFAIKLHDYEMASNVGNWQWVAGSGVDAAPYFRIFNPTTQLQKFDKDHQYVKKWVPEYQDPSYCLPMVDHRDARERCMKVYKEGLAN